MNKKIIIIITAIIALIALSLVWFVQNSKLKRLDRIPLSTENGIVWIKDFRNRAIYSDSHVTMIENNRYYDFYYDYDKQIFYIRLFEPNVAQVRPIAEKGLLEILKISESQACKLDISITVPPQIDERKSGVEYGLSFCPSGAILDENDNIIKRNPDKSNSVLSNFSNNPLYVALSICAIIIIVIFLSLKHFYR